MKRHAVTVRLGEAILAETVNAVRIEGNYYIPEQDVGAELHSSVLTTLCLWKGIARYRHLDVDGRTTRNAAWTYPLPSPLVWPIRRMLAFAPETGITINVDNTSESHPHEKETGP